MAPSGPHRHVAGYINGDGDSWLNCRPTKHVRHPSLLNRSIDSLLPVLEEIEERKDSFSLRLTLNGRKQHNGQAEFQENTANTANTTSNINNTNTTTVI